MADDLHISICRICLFERETVCIVGSCSSMERAAIINAAGYEQAHPCVMCKGNDPSALINADVAMVALMSDDYSIFRGDDHDQ